MLLQLNHQTYSMVLSNTFDYVLKYIIWVCLIANMAINHIQQPYNPIIAVLSNIFNTIFEYIGLCAGKFFFWCCQSLYTCHLYLPAIQYNNWAVKQIPLKLQTCLFVPSLPILYIFFQENCFMPGIYFLCLSSIMVNNNGQQRRLKDISILTLHAVSICSYYILQLTKICHNIYVYSMDD